MTPTSDKVWKTIQIDRRIARAMAEARGVNWNAVVNEAVRFKLKTLGLKPAAK